MSAAASSSAADSGSLGQGPFVRTVRLSKWYGRVTALQDLSVHIEGGIWGLLGPNGSGKSTFLNLLAGQLRPGLGDVSVSGQAPFGAVQALGRIGLCPEADALYEELSGLEFVTAMAKLSGMETHQAGEKAAGAMHEFGLGDVMNRRVGTYSRGMRQRTKLAQAVVHDPQVLLLDEPLTGTDPTSRNLILDRIRARAAAGALVIFSTHVLHEVDALTDQVLVIVRGQLVAQGRTYEIRNLLDEHPHMIVVQCNRPRDLAARVINTPAVAGLRFVDDNSVVFEASDPDAAYQTISQAVLDGGFELEALVSPDANLETLFHYLVERSARGAGTGADAAVGAATRTSTGATS